MDQCAELIGLIPGLKVVLIDRCDALGSCGHVLDNTCDEWGVMAMASSAHLANYVW